MIDFKRIEYLGIFLTLRCSLSCSYCLNRFGKISHSRPELGPEEWLSFLNSLELPPDLPITLQGGEPSSYPHFFQILSGLNKNLKVDLLTNLSFDPQEFVRHASHSNFLREAPYAPIRASFHPEQMDIIPLLEKIDYLISYGFRVGLYMVNHPRDAAYIEKVSKLCHERAIDFRLKDFLGYYDGKLYGKFKYDLSERRTKVLCRTNELLFSPEGNLHRCHRDLYLNELSLGNILKPPLMKEEGFYPCSSFGQCHPCDVKIKTNRFQEQGHTSVEITED